MNHRSRARRRSSRWQVHRERCRIVDPRPPPPSKQAAKIEDILPDLIQKLGMREDHWLQTLTEEWGKVVGQAVARHTRPGDVRHGKLVVFVDSSVWLGELSRYGKSQIAARLRKLYPGSKIRDIALQLDPEGPRATYNA